MIHFRQRSHIAEIVLGVLILLLLFPITARAQQPIVYGVFFYSPTCPHCHEVITNHWPGIQEEFGQQLRILFIDVSTPQGSQIMGTAIDALNIASNGVPMLIIGTDVWVGSRDIPHYAPQSIRAGLNSGGVGYPAIPGIDAVFQSALPDVPAPSTGIEQRSLLDDPANLVALVVLSGLIAGIGLMGAAGWKLVTQQNQRLIHALNGLWGQRMILVGTLIGVGLAGSLVMGSFEDPIILLISSSVLAAFVILAFHIFRSASVGQLPGWLIPLTLTAGLLVAGYLAYVEMTLVEATCGAMGDCNAVQQSPYAYILGIPVGVIGIIGYLGMFALWALNRLNGQRWIDLVLFGAVFLGLGFSTYLTFMEPFVIGASCVWCLISAVVMGLLLWMMAPAGWSAVDTLYYSGNRQKRSV